MYLLICTAIFLLKRLSVELKISGSKIMLSDTGVIQLWALVDM
jgi:hypothetical protein